MLLAYVSDERYVAVAECLVEIEQNGRFVLETRSTATGAVRGDLDPGHYAVTLVRDGFGSKRAELHVTADHIPAQFRLLRDGLWGYCWPKWVRSGERSEFRVHAVEPYHLTLWRYGWKKEFVRNLGWFDEHGPRAVMQITPDGDYTQTGVAWNKTGYGSPHLSQFATGPEQSGLYYLHARTESGKFFAFPWVVAPSEPRSAVAVLLSTNTWNAYNNFGGRSNYINSNGLPERPAVNARQDLTRYTRAGAFNEWAPRDEEYPPLSFERPEPNNWSGEDVQVTDPIAGRQQCHLAPAEWRTLGWLEREGIEHDVYAEAQLHDGTLNLDAYKLLIISVHPEYWSRQMYLAVKAWVYERGGKLMYLGGNGLNCEVEFVEPDALHFRNHQPSEGGEFRYFNQELGREVDSRMDRTLESEANLLGVAMTETGIMTSAPYRVLMADHWVFAGTGLSEGDTFGENSLHERCPGGASGHETDKISPSSPANTVLLAKGLNPDDGGAEIVTFETPTGGAVFSVGSITWPASLLVDEAVSMITRNVIERFLAD